MGHIHDVLTIGLERHFETLSKRIFGRKGAKVVHAPDMVLALRSIGLVTPDLVIVDVRSVTLSEFEINRQIDDANITGKPVQVIIVPLKSEDGSDISPTAFANLPSSGMEIAIQRARTP